jgi:hypothetical protein
VSDAVVRENAAPESPELAAMRRWAKDNEVSPMGLSMPEDEKGRPLAWKQVWEQLSFADVQNHTHIEEHGLMQSAATSPPLLALHEIRVSGGIENAFVFLFHLRYQFCLVSDEARGFERNRLVNLFTTAISRNFMVEGWSAA